MAQFRAWAWRSARQKRGWKPARFGRASAAPLSPQIPTAKRRQSPQPSARRDLVARSRSDASFSLSDESKKIRPTRFRPMKCRAKIRRFAIRRFERNRLSQLRLTLCRLSRFRLTQLHLTLCRLALCFRVCLHFVATISNGSRIQKRFGRRLSCRAWRRWRMRRDFLA